MKEISSKYRMMVHFMVSFELLTKKKHFNKCGKMLQDYVLPFVYPRVFFTLMESNCRRLYGKIDKNWNINMNQMFFFVFLRKWINAESFVFLDFWTFSKDIGNENGSKIEVDHLLKLHLTFYWFQLGFKD